MTETAIVLCVHCHAAEQPTWHAAARLLEGCLGQGGAARVQARFITNIQDLTPDLPGVPVASLLPAVLDPATPWPAVQAQCLATCRALAGGAGMAFVCTVLRHLSADAVPPGDRAVILHRIRLANLLAAEVSQQTGVSVIDLDRALSHAGAASLGADARLGSAAAAALAARTIVGTLLSCGLDHLLTDGQIQAGLAWLDTQAPASGTPFRAPSHVEPVGAARPGRLQQTRLVFSEIGGEPGFAALLRDMLRGRVAASAAIPRLAQKLAARARRSIKA